MTPRALSALMYGLLSASVAAAEPMGRLFFTPSERQELERNAEKIHARENPDALEASSLIVNGVIQRKDGSRIVWINGKAQEMEACNTLAIVHIPAQGNRPAIEARVGQAVPLHPPAQQSGVSPP